MCIPMAHVAGSWVKLVVGPYLLHFGPPGLFFSHFETLLFWHHLHLEVPTKLLADKKRTSHLKVTETMFSSPGLDYSRLLKRLNEAVSITTIHWGENGKTLFVSSLQSSSIAIVWFLGGRLFKTGQTRPACVFAHYYDWSSSFMVEW